MRTRKTRKAGTYVAQSLIAILTLLLTVLFIVFFLNGQVEGLGSKPSLPPVVDLPEWTSKEAETTELTIEPLTEPSTEVVTEPITTRAEPVAESPEIIKATQPPVENIAPPPTETKPIIEATAETTQETTPEPEPEPEPEPPAYDSYEGALYYLKNGTKYSGLTEEARVAVLQALTNQMAAANDCRPYVIEVKPDDFFPEGWGAFARRGERKIFLRESNFQATTGDFARWYLAFIVMHESTHMLHFEYLFDEHGNGAFLADTDLYGEGEQATAMLEEISRNLVGADSIKLSPETRDAYVKQKSEYTADMTGLKFLQAHMPAGVANINWEDRRPVRP
jgi:hypothetical protein